MASAHDDFIQGLRGAFKEAGYNNAELNNIIINQFNAYHQQILEMMELEKTVQVLSGKIKELTTKKK
jgi:hypothetical protein